MPTPTVIPPPPRPLRPVASGTEGPPPSPDGPTLRIVAWVDPVAAPHGMHPCSRYVELYWLGVIGPSTTWLLRRLNYGLEVHGHGYDLHLPETARSLGLGDKMGKNSPFRRALARLVTFELARPQGPGDLAVRSKIPPLPLRHLSRLPESLQRSHRRWLAEQQLSEPERMRRRAQRLAASLADAGHDRATIEQRLAQWQFHPSVAFHAAGIAAEGRSADRDGGWSGDADPSGGGGRGGGTGDRDGDPDTTRDAGQVRVDRAHVGLVRPLHPLLADRTVETSAPDLPDGVG